MGSRSQTSQSLPGWAQPYAQSLLRTGGNVVAPGSATDSSWANPNGGIFELGQMPPGLLQQVAPFNPTQQAGLGALTQGALGSAGIADAGAQQFQNTLGGAYLSPDSNPYLGRTFDAASQAMVNQYRDAIAPSIQTSAQQAGVSGGSGERAAMDQSRYGLGQNLEGLAAQIYGGNYAQERALQTQAIGMVPALQAAMAQPGQQLLGAGTLEQSQSQTALDAARANTELQTQYPYTQISYLANLIGNVTGGGGQVTAGTSK